MATANVDIDGVDVEVKTRDSAWMVSKEKSVKFSIGHCAKAWIEDDEGNPQEYWIYVHRLFESEGGDPMVQYCCLFTQQQIAGNIDFFDPNNKVHAPRGFKRDCELVLCDTFYTMPLESVTVRAWTSDNTDNYTEKRVDPLLSIRGRFNDQKSDAYS